MDLTQATSLAGATVLVFVIVEAFKRALAWGQAQVDRFGPLVSELVGVLVVVLLTAAQRPLDASTFAGSVILGVLAGASASGIYDQLPDGLKNIGRSDA